MQSLFGLGLSHLAIFACFSCLRTQIQKKKIAKINVKEKLPMFSSRSFMISVLTFKSLIHLEFIFVYSKRMQFSLILLFFKFFYLFILIVTFFLLVGG